MAETLSVTRVLSLLAKWILTRQLSDMNGYKETLNKPVPENIGREQGAMPQPMGSSHVDHGRQCVVVPIQKI